MKLNEKLDYKFSNRKINANITVKINYNDTEKYTGVIQIADYVKEGIKENNVNHGTIEQTYRRNLNYLNSLVEAGIITKFQDLNVTIDKEEPDIMNIEFKAMLMYPLNCIEINVMVGK